MAIRHRKLIVCQMLLLFSSSVIFFNRVVYLELDSSLKVTKPEDAKLDVKFICYVVGQDNLQSLDGCQW